MDGCGANLPRKPVFFDTHFLLKLVTPKEEDEPAEDCIAKPGRTNV